MYLISDANVDPDDFTIGRNFAYAQMMPELLSEYTLEHLVLDRQYWSSYVYGQAWRDKYDKQFWTEHIQDIEEQWGEYLEDIKFILITPDEEDFKRAEELVRESDNWDYRVDYRNQHELYEEVFEISRANKFRMRPFQTKEYIIKVFKDILES